MYEEYRIAAKKRIIFFEVLGLAFCAGVYILTELFAVKNVRVEGNVHYTAADIRNITERGWFADNTLVLSAGFGGVKVKDLPFIEAISVKADSRDSITISVREKEVAGYVEYMDRYMYFDKDGIVVEASDVPTEGLPLVEGLNFDSFSMYEALPVGNEHVFQTVLNMTQALKAAGLKVETISFNNNYEISFCCKGIIVSMGDDDHLNEKVQMAAKLLASEELMGRSGTLHIENYSRGRELYYFKNGEGTLTE
ncbi:MAG: cell division protein FtsQ/DivIB [Lachnospiraceae bacterium]|nr:cell division protein FtsQ/DivIB [Lachnospiraceae bacterium]